MTTHAVTTPVGRVLLRFRALRNFACAETGSIYVVGAVYSLRDGNNALLDRVDTWLDNDDIEVLDDGDNARG
jgi:hypothetical protein